MSERRPHGTTWPATRGPGTPPSCHDVVEHEVLPGSTGPSGNPQLAAGDRRASWERGVRLSLLNPDNAGGGVVVCCVASDRAVVVDVDCVAVQVVAGQFAEVD